MMTGSERIRLAIASAFLVGGAAHASLPLLLAVMPTDDAVAPYDAPPLPGNLAADVPNPFLRSESADDPPPSGTPASGANDEVDGMPLEGAPLGVCRSRPRVR